MIRLRTVDVWDTLLRRRCHPDAVKLHTASLLLFHCRADIRPELRDSRTLFHLRLEVERDVARASATNPARDDEYSLREVFNLWVTRALQGDRNLASILDELEEEEFLQEQSVSYPDPGIGAVLLRYPAERTLFLSDFYMPAERLSALLKSKGLLDGFDGGHSSCDHGLNKRSGRLYLALQKLYGVAPEEHFHIGDNLRSDVKVPRGLGMTALHYRHSAEERGRNRRNCALHDRDALYRRIQRKCRDTALKLPDRKQARCFDYGITLAPLFVGFALFILESVQCDQAGQLFFFVREGEFFAKTYEELRNGPSRLSRFTPAAGVLEVSRMATFSASLQDISVDEMMRLWSAYDPQSMKTWAYSLGLDPAIVAAWCDRYGIKFDLPLLHPWQDDRVRKLLQDGHCRQTLGQLIQEKRLLLLDYLKTQGLAEGGRVAVVDIGWRGSIQDNIATVLPSTRFFGYYLGLQEFLNPQPLNGSKTAFGPNLNTVPEGVRLFRNLPLIEMLTNSPRGSVTGYERTADGRVCVRRLIDEDEDQVHFDVVQHIQAGILHGVRTWAEYVHVHALSSAELRAEGEAIWARMIERTPRMVAGALARLKHNELFGRGAFERPKTERALLARFLGLGK
jgi:FMN phosphatase YigB (HAD superfamily)